MQAIKGLARQIQGALPVVGLLSRLSSPSGGIGNDVLVSTLQLAIYKLCGHYCVLCTPHHLVLLPHKLLCKQCMADTGCEGCKRMPVLLQRYPEFARKLLYEGSSPEFLDATSEWEKAYGKVQPGSYQLTSVLE